MPRRARGPFLWLEPAERDGDGRLLRNANWVVIDRRIKRRTGCGAAEIAEAEQFLSAYLVEKYRPGEDRRLDPKRIPVAEIIALYLDEAVVRHARPKETGKRLERIEAFFGGDYLAQVTKSRQADYARQRASASAARRELEDFRAAVGHWDKSLLSRVPISLPPAGEERARWLTRSEAAALIKAAWRLRQRYGKANLRRTGQHVARAILVGLYTGTRIGAVCGAAIRRTVNSGYVDLEHGIFYRRRPGKRETNKRQPTIRLPDRLLAHLRRWERLGISKRHIVEWDGEPVRRINKAFRAARAAAGLGPDVVPHSLRHTAATWLMQAAVDPWQAAGYLGMSLETLLRVYGHHHPDHQEGARASITGKQSGSNKANEKRTARVKQ